MKKPFLLLFAMSMMLCMNSMNVQAQRYMEKLDSGLIAMRTGTNSVLISWRILGDEYAQNATYNLYRESTLIASNLSVSNYVDTTTTDYSYSVAAVIGGTEQALSPATTIRGWESFTIPVRSINGSYTTHTVNDASVGDLDGDGEYEIVIKRLANDESANSINYHFLEAYELDGTFMWSINMGPNLIHNQEVNFLVYDFDNDGKAEIATRTSDGMIDGLGNNIGDRDGDGQINYRSTAAANGPFLFRVDGPDYISIFDGQTGAEIAWDSYIDLAPIQQWGLPGMNLSQLGHRSTKCMWAVAYTDGVNPSFVISRGIYERIKLEAWNFRNGTLTKEWAWDSNPNGQTTAYTGQGNHNLAAGDLDGDGRDEITYGGMAVNEYGVGMYSTGFGHGDAAHLADINPNISGLEFFGAQEYANGSTIPGLAIRNATNGTVQWASYSSGDIGRCMAADIDPNYYGMEVWGSDGSGLRSCTGQQISTNIPTATGGGASYNFGIWWDGDVQREILDKTVIGKWNGSGTDRMATLYNIEPISDNNGSKSNPCLMADILGDWREEVIYRRTDNTGMVVFVSPYSTTQRMYTLMHDPNYRSAIAWQNNTYNQPPNLGFYFGGGMSTPPNPNIQLVEPVPNGITLQASADNGVVNLSWSLQGISGIQEVLRDTDPNPAGRGRLSYVTNGTTYSDNTVTNGTTYYYWVKVTATDGNTYNSAAIEATPLSCTPTTITPYLQVNGGSWQAANDVTINQGSSVKFGPHPTTGGSWAWTGCGSSGSSREYTVTPTGNCIATATYTNSNGCVSTQDFNITVNQTVETITIQENETGFCGVDGTVDSNNAGYSGSGFANTANASGNGIDWSVTVPSTGTYTLRWRYANGGSTDRNGNVMINGNTATSASFPSTGNWTTWAENSNSMVTVTLAAGVNSIRLEATTSSGLGNIDKLEVEGITPVAANCSGSGSRKGIPSEIMTDSESENESKLYISPNPISTGETIKVTLPKDAKQISIYNTHGQLVHSIALSGQSSINLNHALSPGIYIVTVISDEGSVQTKLIVK
ncbi:rhamnogalacturonan lyase family protein [Wenyingzhuangia marina]|uniref:Rhamnogalacturonan endolyase n=1 Tax=Wenyingzhuangia marina TaxID=1195760 RepID=A0A1M5TVG0_9FLAO|nr:T9SS type A sorting domain-containing protein [Wenyingzhuangia marina]SHH54704.1 rhamnogalacturonan endolyase [Wenyingzhuangia marina]